MGKPIELFMPVYETSLAALITEFRDREVMPEITKKMFKQMLSALEHIHNSRPPIVHRDIKPHNILSHNGDFFLADFGLAKTVDTKKTVVGTLTYVAPEVIYEWGQTQKLDIYSLGVTVLECLVRLPIELFENNFLDNWVAWHRNLLELAGLKETVIVPLLDGQADRRPDASELLEFLFDQSRPKNQPRRGKSSFLGKRPAPADPPEPNPGGWQKRLRVTPARSSRLENISRTQHHTSLMMPMDYSLQKR